MTLLITSTLERGWQIITVKGQVDSKTVNELRDYLEQEYKSAQSLGLELTEVPFLSSAGLRTLLTLYRQTQSNNLSLALIGLRPEIADTMKVTGFYQYFTIYHSLADLPALS
jgi:anti-sigma B factor antagonist